MRTKYDIGDVVCCVSKIYEKLEVTSFEIEKIFIDSEGITYSGYDRAWRYKEEYLARTPEELERKYLKMLSKEMKERKNEIQQLFKEYKIVTKFFPQQNSIDEQIDIQKVSYE
ncbi:MAG TPA: hypothetical protein PKV66_04630 [Candidatus Pelethenecus sp.]|nr:hypothetical protein [Candidatus Pelethenecus sp.]